MEVEEKQTGEARRCLMTIVVMLLLIGREEGKWKGRQKLDAALVAEKTTGGGFLEKATALATAAAPPIQEVSQHPT